VVVRSAWRFGVELFISGGGALRGFVVELPPSLGSEIYGSVEPFFPSPAMAWRTGRSSCNKKKVEMRSLAMAMVDRGVGSQEPATGDFPSAEGPCLIQAIKEHGGGGAPPAASRPSSSTTGPEGSFVIFFCFWTCL
jgi:hypothetical protein